MAQDLSRLGRDVLLGIAQDLARKQWGESTAKALEKKSASELIEFIEVCGLS